MNQQDPRWNPAQDGHHQSIPYWPQQDADQHLASPSSFDQQGYPPPSTIYNQPYQQNEAIGQPYQHPSQGQAYSAYQGQGNHPEGNFQQAGCPNQTYGSYQQGPYWQNPQYDTYQSYRSHYPSQIPTYDRQGYSLQQTALLSAQQIADANLRHKQQSPNLPSEHDSLSRQNDKYERGKEPLSSMAVTSLVVGVIALATSFIPIINNITFLIALPGIVFGCIGTFTTKRKRKQGLAIAISGLVLNLVSVILVIVLQGIYINAWNETINPQTIADSSASAFSSSSSSAASQSSSSSSTAGASSNSTSVDAKSFQDLPLGTLVEYASGLTITVNSVESGLVRDFDDTSMVCVSVTYVNNGTKTQSFNTYDWKGQDANGAQRSASYFTDAVNELNSGSLAPEGTITGNLYFEAPIAKVVYEANFFTDTQNASWIVP